MLKAGQKLLRVLICVVGDGDSVGKSAGGVDVAADDVRSCRAALETALPAEDYRADFFVLHKILTVYYCAGVQDYNSVRKSGGDAVDEALFRVRKIVVAGYSLSVNALRGEAAESYYCNIRICGGLGYQLVGHMRLGNVHTREGVVDYVVFFLAEGHGVDPVPYLLYLGAGRDTFACLLDVFLVELGGRPKDADLALVLFQLEAVVDVAGIGAENVAASAAALYVFDGRLAEERNSCPAL